MLPLYSLGERVVEEFLWDLDIDEVESDLAWFSSTLWKGYYMGNGLTNSQSGHSRAASITQAPLFTKR